MAAELFETPGVGAGFLINELAMRPHNTGHWTQDGSVTSQFEQHLRAVLNLPLGATDLLGPVVVMKNFLGGENQDLFSAFPRPWPASPRRRSTATASRSAPAARSATSTSSAAPRPTSTPCAQRATTVATIIRDGRAQPRTAAELRGERMSASTQPQPPTSSSRPQHAGPTPPSSGW